MANVKELTNFYDYGLKNPVAKSPEKIMENIDFLYNKIQACTRDVTYFDLYKISTIVNQASELQSQINALPSYHSLIINTPIITGDGKRYNTGDIIVKMNDGTFSHIEAQRGGIFYPSKITKLSTDSNNYSYKFQFSYESSAPASSEEPVVADRVETENNIVWTTNYASDIVFENMTGGAAVSPYNQVFKDKVEISGITPSVGSNDSTLAMDPIVHAYNVASNGVSEEVYCDQVITYSGGQYSIKLIAPVKLVNKVVVK